MQQFSYFYYALCYLLSPLKQLPTHLLLVLSHKAKEIKQSNHNEIVYITLKKTLYQKKVNNRIKYMLYVYMTL